MQTKTLQQTTLALSLLAMTFASCGSSDNTAKTEATETKTTATTGYTWNQKVFCLNMLSNISAEYTNLKIEDSTAWAVNTVLGNANVQQYIGQWTCVWGPRVIFNALLGDVPTNTMYIARQGNANNYVVAIAGTDPASYAAAILEDANVLTAPLWTYSKESAHPGACISKGTSDGLNRLISMKDKLFNGGAREYLGSLTKDGAAINVWVTGHSLGGFLSPTYALYLSDTKSDWVGKGSATINCLAAAGATPGNGAFAIYYDNQLGKNTTRVWNTMDVVPHAYQPNMLDSIPTLYSGQNPDDTLPAKIKGLNSKDVIAGLIALSTKMNYTQLTPSTIVGFTSAMYTQPGDNAFFGQVFDQHIPAYATFFGVDSFQTGVMRAINLPYPFFSLKGTPRTAILNYDTAGKNFNNMNP